MRYVYLVILLFSVLMVNTPLAYAQQDINDIIDEILKDEQLPTSQQSQVGRINNIPVEIIFDATKTELPSESMLVVSAYAPPPANIRRSSPLMLGQTRLLLTEMASPLKVIIAAPSARTQDLDFARIEAKIINSSGAVIYDLKQPGKYDGYEATILNLVHVGEISKEETNVSLGKFSTEKIRGSVKLNGRPPKFSGSNLVVRLIEDGLAGGNSSVVLGEVRQILDDKRAPFTFKFEGKVPSSQNEVPLALKVWIEDWAGRKTHVTPAPTPYTGSKTKYRIRLDAIGPQVYNPMPPKQAIRKAMSKTVAVKKTVAAAKSKPTGKLKTNIKPTPKKVTVVKAKPIAKNKKVILVATKVKQQAKPVIKAKSTPKHASLPPYQKITGKAFFNASKGLPRGSILIAELERKNSGQRPALLASTRVFLDGLSGDVSFKLKANTVDMDPTLPPAKLRVRIEDKNGKLFFSNPGGTAVRNDFNTVKLTTSPYY